MANERWRQRVDDATLDNAILHDENLHAGARPISHAGAAAMLMLDSALHARVRAAPLVAVHARDAVRAAALAALVAASGHEVVGEHEADLILTDRAHPASLPLLVVSDEPADTAASVLPARVSAAQLAAALPAVAAGLVVRIAASPNAAPDPAPATADRSRASLTPRELEILSFLSVGLSNKAVARRMGISQHTVKFHLEAVFAKLAATSRAEAVAKGLRTGLIEL